MKASRTAQNAFCAPWGTQHAPVTTEKPGRPGASLFHARRASCARAPGLRTIGPSSAPARTHPERNRASSTAARRTGQHQVQECACSRDSPGARAQAQHAGGDAPWATRRGLAIAFGAQGPGGDPGARGRSEAPGPRARCVAGGGRSARSRCVAEAGGDRTRRVCARIFWWWPISGFWGWRKRRSEQKIRAKINSNGSRACAVCRAPGRAAQVSTLYATQRTADVMPNANTDA